VQIHQNKIKLVLLNHIQPLEGIVGHPKVKLQNTYDPLHHRVIEGMVVNIKDQHRTPNSGEIVNVILRQYPTIMNQMRMSKNSMANKWPNLRPTHILVSPNKTNEMLFNFVN